MRAQPPLPRPPHRRPSPTPLRGACGVALALAASALLPLAGCAAPASPAAPPRNLVVLCLDTLRVDHLGIYGYRRDTSPRLDRLAAAGTVFDWALAQSNWTVPATATLLTGLYPDEHGAEIVGEIRHLGQMPPSPLRPQVETLGQILDGAGFDTALLSANPFLYGRFKNGFDHAEVGRQSAGELTDAALDWLAGRGERPFFLYMQYMDLHQPIEPPEPYFSHFPVAEGGERGPSHVEWSFGRQVDLQAPPFRRYRAHKLALYDGALLYIDTQIGRLLDQLAASGRDRDTLVVVTSDHGEEFWDHVEIQRRIDGDPRGIWGVGHGHTMFQELLHVPLFVAGPGIADDRRVGCDVRHLDVAPTLLELLGLPARPAMRGVSLTPMLAAGREPPACRPLPLVADSPAYGPDSRAVVWKRRKLITRIDGVELLFDLRDDPGERHDLAASRPETVAEMRALLERELAPISAADERREGTVYDEETERQLRALGYL